MNFETYFRFSSYSVVACGTLALLASGGIGWIVALIFAAAMFVAWRLESTKWQVSERFGLVLIVLALPFYYLDWQFQLSILARERAGAATLAHLILGLCVIKLLQIKADRDWIFLFLISFFELLLAAGLSISPTFFATLILYLLCAAATIIAFEIRKSSGGVRILQTASNAVSTNFNRRLSLAATAILLLITLVAVPVFFMMPRVGGAGFGGNGNSVTASIGFSDQVRLGNIGTLQESGEVVMRVRLENPGAATDDRLRWRGVSLDRFDNKNWSRTGGSYKEPLIKNAEGIYSVGRQNNRAADLTVQTVYLEPLDTDYIFGASRVIGIQGGFNGVNIDREDGITLPPSRSRERVVYKVYSDTAPPAAAFLRADKLNYEADFAERYLQQPSGMDARIADLGAEIIAKSGATNYYDATRAIETYLQNELAYSLEMRAGGAQPVADFLFNVRAGHCEYFSTSMVLMLRSQGIAARVVNGFQTGTYNDAADAYIVTQREAHSWVEVYFPATESWVTFDPTPTAGFNLSDGANQNFVTRQMTKYLEAAEMFWLQYVVAYDNQEQRTLAQNVRDGFLTSQDAAEKFVAGWQKTIEEWWENVKGARGAQASLQTILWTALIILASIVVIIASYFGFRRLSLRRILQFLRLSKISDETRVVEFYERLTKALAKKGVRRAPSQTPLEFAVAVDSAEALKITESYNRVRFGANSLTDAEAAEIERYLLKIEKNES